ncbi:MAG: hypothetical protein JW881_16745 [Spirochaetales bacterium]|nr:hypothetical protein [Spirochaetales bacterium]
MEQFRKPNFFTGLPATPKLFNEVQDYHLSKENFYNVIFRGAGIVPGVADELKVSPIKKKGGSLSVEIAKGFAIDKKGRGLFLYDAVTKTIDPKKYDLPATIFIILRYHEVPEDFFQDPKNTTYQGYQRKLETATVEITDRITDDSCIELARIRLEEDRNEEIKAIAMPKDIAKPESNEIDVRFVTWVRSAQSGLSPYLKDYLASILDETIKVANAAYDAVNLPGLRELQTFAFNARMLVQGSDIAFRDCIYLFSPIFDVNKFILQEMYDYERKAEEKKGVFTTKKVFSDYRNTIYEMGDKIKDFDGSFEKLDAILKSHKRTIESLRTLFSKFIINWEDIKVWNTDFPPVLIIGNERYTLADYIDFGDPEIVKAHEVNFKEAENLTNQKEASKYPGSTQEVIDKKITYHGGSIGFTINNLIKRRKLILIRRTDIFHGNYDVEVTIGSSTGLQMHIEGIDQKNRWRNFFIQVDEEMIDANSLPCSFIMSQGNKDTFGKIWIYQLLY